MVTLMANRLSCSISTKRQTIRPVGCFLSTGKAWQKFSNSNQFQFRENRDWEKNIFLISTVCAQKEKRGRKNYGIVLTSQFIQERLMIKILIFNEELKQIKNNLSLLGIKPGSKASMASTLTTSPPSLLYSGIASQLMALSFVNLNIINSVGYLKLL